MKRCVNRSKVGVTRMVRSFVIGLDTVTIYIYTYIYIYMLQELTRNLPKQLIVCDNAMLMCIIRVVYPGAVDIATPGLILLSYYQLIWPWLTILGTSLYLAS